MFEWILFALTISGAINEHVALVPENPDFDAIPVDGDGFEILGIVIGTLHDRKYA